MPRKRLYTEREISAILKRATELQRTRGADEAPGLSLEELQQVAEDVGIDRDLVRRAALDMEEGKTIKADLLLGGPVEVDREWLVDGAMSDDKWEDALGEIRRAFTAEGETRIEGRTRDWIHRDQMGGRVHVSLSPADDQTRVRISYGMKEWLWLYVVFLSMSIGGVAVQASLLHLGALAETGISVLVIIAFYLVGWLSFRSFSRRQDRKVQRLMARLDNLLGASEVEDERATTRGTLPAQDRLDDGLLDAEIAADERLQTGRRDRQGS